MNFEVTNNLTDEEILRLYDDIIETNNENFVTWTHWYVRCSNGYSGRTPQMWFYENWRCCSNNAYYTGGCQKDATLNVCGQGVCGIECCDC